MPDRSVTTSADTENHEHSSAGKPLSFPRWSEGSRWPAYAALAIALIAVVLAALAYFFPAHKGASVAQQSGDAKANVCSAFDTARKAVVINTHLESPNPSDAAGQLAVAANARLALIGGGAYLRDRLEANTAAPADLVNTADSMADTIQQLGMNYLTQAGAGLQDPLRHTLDTEITQLNKMCS